MVKLTPNEAFQLVKVGEAYHEGTTANMVPGKPPVPSGQKKGMHPVYITRIAALMRGMNLDTPARVE